MGHRPEVPLADRANVASRGTRSTGSAQHHEREHVGGQPHRGSFSLWFAANLGEEAESAEFERLLGLGATRRV